MSILIKGIDVPEKHHMSGYYISDDGRVFDISRKNVVGKALPSAQPERKKGEWIHKPDIYLDEQTWECSECGEPWIFIEGTPSENNANFCPNCGADMRGELNE